MRITDNITCDLEYYLNNKKVLEIACGDSEFSLSASKYAKEILATDITLERFERKNLTEIPKNIELKEMDASDLLLRKVLLIHQFVIML